MLKSILVTKIFKHGVWLAASTATNITEARLENHDWLTWILTWILASNPGPSILRIQNDATDVEYARVT